MIQLKPRLFNRKASDAKSKPDEILKALSLRAGEHVADVGAGGGYFSVRLAQAVGEKGRVYAVDTNASFLKFINNLAKNRGLSNVETVLAKEGRLVLPRKSLDLIFLRNVYHHLSDRVEYFRKLAVLLRPEGRVAIVEYKSPGILSYKSLGKFKIMRGHYVPKEVIVKEMDKARYRLEAAHDFLPKQSFTIYSLKRRR
ncbi:MAG: methyltransferase domain-containing protein [Candidatus Hadarchaeota archaeon]